MLVNRRRTFKNRNIRLYILVSLLALFFLLFIINRIFLITDQVYDIKDISSEALEFYFSLEKSFNIEWYYFAAINDMDGNLESNEDSNIKKFISFYNSNGHNVEGALINLRGVDFKDELIKKTERFKGIDKVFRDKGFPVPKNISYTYDNDWGSERTYGGEREHEGIDIIADKGVPIISIGNGKIKNIGWNELGGWRIGITGDDNIYYYYAHLDSYEKAFRKGEKISKGDVLGYIGSTGYGPEGTSGKFVDHLHFGMYENNIAINPYPFLKGWEFNISRP